MATTKMGGGGPAGTKDNLSADELKKVVKDNEKKIIKQRGELNLLKQENEKLVKLIRKEVGNEVNIEDLMREDSQWKGRA